MKNQKKLKTSSLMLIASAIAFSGATYAWFTTSRNASVSGLSFTATTAQGLLISADAKNWSSSLTSSDFTDKETNITTSKLFPVSTAGEIDKTTNSLKMYKGVYDGSTITSTAYSASSTDTESGYQKYTIYFNNLGNEKKKLSLSFASGNASSVTDGTTDKQTSLATRVAFLRLAESDTNTFSTYSSNSVTIWEPNSTTRSTFYTNSGGTATGKLNYKGLNDEGTSIAVSGGAATEKVGDANTSDTDDTSKNIGLFAIGANKFAKMDVYVWVEGQDVDCNNAQSAGDVNTKLNFVLEDINVG